MGTEDAEVVSSNPESMVGVIVVSALGTIEVAALDVTNSSPLCSGPTAEDSTPAIPNTKANLILQVSRKEWISYKRLKLK